VHRLIPLLGEFIKVELHVTVLSAKLEKKMGGSYPVLIKATIGETEKHQKPTTTGRIHILQKFSESVAYPF
jgi:hypothetical protein